MTKLEQMAADRMIAGKSNHPEQSWDKMTHQELMVEAREELADLYNYFSKMPDESLKESIYKGLELFWRTTEL